MTPHELTDAIDKLIRERLLWNESETPEEAQEHTETIKYIKQGIANGLERGLKNPKPPAKN